MRLLNSHNQAYDDTGLGIRAAGEIYLKHSLVIINIVKTYKVVWIELIFTETEN